MKGWGEHGYTLDFLFNTPGNSHTDRLQWEETGFLGEIWVELSL